MSSSTNDAVVGGGVSAGKNELDDGMTSSDVRPLGGNNESDTELASACEKCTEE